ncbi:MAG TPA: hypothetical protein PKE54_12320, partial [Candidatus Obscuribacter sp.]|nr:hypothetical protein [Candidatus Obscuribacter sp.]
MLPALVPLFPFRTEEEPTLSPSEKGGKGEIITKIAQWWDYLSDFLTLVRNSAFFRPRLPNTGDTVTFINLKKPPFLLFFLVFQGQIFNTQNKHIQQIYGLFFNIDAACVTPAKS